MSYSFNVRAANKDEAKTAVEVEFEKVVAGQPVHARDRAAVLANAYAAIDLLGDDDSKDIGVTCAGYVSWQSAEPPESVPLTSASISASAGYVSREAN
ncbi:hypothetical protein [Cupriavidus alkaliphilus]|uniref:hypothetical protein n=1 Tax=Cupriavidus alkaliphilus TaxID=942866 RepID=UPI00161B6D9D|nr:hypothetical protein [Cupriavidus alkaliphilus]MBB2915875.1 hypothetical protein [Cupriavidus alkaliphilus]